MGNEGGFRRPGRTLDVSSRTAASCLCRGHGCACDGSELDITLESWEVPWEHYWNCSGTRAVLKSGGQGGESNVERGELAQRTVVGDVTPYADGVLRLARLRYSARFPVDAGSGGLSD